MSVSEKFIEIAKVIVEAQAATVYQRCKASGSLEDTVEHIYRRLVQNYENKPSDFYKLVTEQVESVENTNSPIKQKFASAIFNPKQSTKVTKDTKTLNEEVKEYVVGLTKTNNNLQLEKAVKELHTYIQDPSHLEKIVRVLSSSLPKST